MYDFASPNQRHKVVQLTNYKLTYPHPRPASPPPFNPLVPTQAPPQPAFRPSRRLGLAPAADPNDGFQKLEKQLSPGTFALSSQSSFRIGEELTLEYKRSRRPIPPPTPQEKSTGKKRVPIASPPTSAPTTPHQPKSPWRPSPMTLIADIRNSEFRSELGLPIKRAAPNARQFSGEETKPEGKKLVPTKSGNVGRLLKNMDVGEGKETRKEASMEGTTHEFITNQHFAKVYKGRTQKSQVLFLSD